MRNVAELSKRGNRYVDSNKPAHVPKSYVVVFQDRVKLEEEKLALITFVRDIDSHLQQKTGVANYTPGGADRAKRARSLDGNESFTLQSKLGSRYGSSLLNETTPEALEEDEIEDLLEVETEPESPTKSTRGVLGDKENLPL